MLPESRDASELIREKYRYREARGIDWAPVWRASGFRSSANQPIMLRRALALNAVLEQCALPLFAGELFVGNSLGRFVAGGDADELRIACEYLQPLTGRSFTTSFDHHAPDYPTLLSEGIGGMLARVEESKMQHRQPARCLFLDSMHLALESAARHLLRWAAAIETPVQDGRYSNVRATQAAMLRRLSVQPPSTLWEAMQLVLSFHAIFQLDDRYAMAFGRVDQYLYPFYERDRAEGRLNDAEAQQLVDHFLAKIVCNWDIQNICLAGLTSRGEDAVNTLSFMVLDAVGRFRQPGANVTARIHTGTPGAFLMKCAETITTGAGFPALVNDEVQIPALLDDGYPLEEARDYCFVGCIETAIPGRHAPWADSRLNLLRTVNYALWNGKDPLSGVQCGPRTGEPQSWPEFLHAYYVQLTEDLHRHVKELQEIKEEAEMRAEELTSPLLSALTADCIASGLDLCMGGARYPANHGVASMGLGCTADALMAIKRCVYDEERFTLHEMRHMLAMNFTGFETERRLLLNAPKYGNDDDEVDGIAAEVVRVLGEAIRQYHTPRGGQYWLLMAANVANVEAGREVGATPDGRLAGEPLSDAASPTFGRDRHGPTAVARSIAKIDYRQAVGGNVINMKFHPSALAGEEGKHGLVALVRACFALGGIQLQFNTTDRAVLRKAMQTPQDYADLVVRVSGFSAHFTSLEHGIQEDILARTEHGGW